MSASEAAPADLSGVRRIEPFFCDAGHTDPGGDYTGGDYAFLITPDYGTLVARSVENLTGPNRSAVVQLPILRYTKREAARRM